MKKYCLILLLFTQLTIGQITGINTTNSAGTNASAILEIKSTTGGFLPPRMTQVERNAIVTPATGLVIYNTTTNSYENYNGAAWFSLDKKDINPNASPSTIMNAISFGKATGQLKVGTAASGITIPLTVNVSQLGSSASYSISTTVANGVTFSASGIFTATGAQTITLTGSGTPLAVGFYTYTLMNNSTPFSFTLPTTDQHTVVGAAGKFWMAYNLGATAPATSATDYTQFGSLYQWGRGNDGHQLTTRTSLTIGNLINSVTATQSTTFTPNHSLFIINTTNWMSINNNLLWQNVDGINNPCPAGFRIPTNQEIINEFNKAGIINQSTAYKSSLKIVPSGYADKNSTGNLINMGLWSYWWTSTVGTINKAYVYMISSSSTLNPENDKSYGFSVRCIKN